MFELSAVVVLPVSGTFTQVSSTLLSVLTLSITSSEVFVTLIQSILMLPVHPISMPAVSIQSALMSMAAVSAVCAETAVIVSMLSALVTSSVIVSEFSAGILES